MTVLTDGDLLITDAIPRDSSIGQLLHYPDYRSDNNELSTKNGDGFTQPTLIFTAGDPD
ncbi:hypothetical protein G210_0846 [Candida maltosa Xu316]|uniref:Uncharacterized protein n=1 Tax=Candida maltosa (strain Xu316) TaxID=1245528 RepID=M3JZX8_CANMX|nr:hypothetical protein G210_0846 [Candida maltosa Xu316]